MNTKRLLAGGVAIAVIGLAAGGWWWQRAAGVQAVVVPALPAVPDLAAATPQAREAIRNADGRARGRWTAEKGLGELSRVYHANGFLDAAVRCYEVLDQLEPREPKWLHRHAIILAGFGEIDPAMAMWRRVVALAPDYAPARLRLADSLLKTSRLDEAAAMYEEVLRRHPKNPYAQLGLARIDFEAQRWERARSRLESLVEQTNYELGYDLIVSLYERLGEQGRAAAIRGMMKASGAYRDPVDPWMDELLDVCYDAYRLSVAAGTMAREAAPKSVQLLERAIALAPDKASNYYQLGTLAVQMGNTAMAREKFEQCTRVDPNFTDGWAQLSDLQLQLGQTTASNQTLAEGLRLNPNSPGLHLMRARRLQQAGDIDQAVHEYKRSAELRPNEADAFLELGSMLIGVGRAEEGIAQVQLGYKVEPANPLAISILAFNAVVQGDEPEARRWFEKVRAQPRVRPEQLQALFAAYEKQFGHAP
jgi:tetratricopeptide (TPR) repeat protein